MKLKKKKIFRFQYERSPVGSLFTNEKQKARDIVDTFATHSGHVHDVTDRQKNGSPHGRVFDTFKCQFLSYRTRN